MLDRLIGNIKFFINRKVYATIKLERHHLVTLELLARKWGMGLENAEETLKVTTKDSIISSLIPPTMR